MNRFLSLLILLASTILVLISCEKETLNNDKGASGYLRYKIDNKAYSIEGITGISAAWREIDNGSNPLNPAKWRNTISWDCNYYGEQFEFFMIELIDSTELRLGHFEGQDFELSYFLNFQIAYYSDQGWIIATSTHQTKNTKLTITRLDETWLEGSFSGVFDDGVRVSEGEFKIFLGKW